MSDALSQIGDFLSSGAGKSVLTAGTAGTGLVQNIIANNEAQKKQKFVENLISNPAAFSKYVSQFEQPLAAGLTQDVDRSVSANLAEKGLGSSPTVMANAEAQALAPFVQQQKDAASQQALQALGIYTNSPTTKPIDISSILKALMGPSAPVANPTAGINLNDVPQGPLIPQGLLPTPLIGGDTTDVPATFGDYSGG